MHSRLDCGRKFVRGSEPNAFWSLDCVQIIGVGSGIPKALGYALWILVMERFNISGTIIPSVRV